MAPKIEKKSIRQPNGEEQGLTRINIIADSGEQNAKRRQFLVLLDRRYGYTNEKSVDEMKRLLKQFYFTNKSLGIYPVKKKHKRPPTEKL